MRLSKEQLQKRELKRIRTGYKTINTQGLVMTCVKYVNALNIVVEFDCPYYKTNSCWSSFIKGKIRNPKAPTVYGVGIVDNKYPTHKKNGLQPTKEYQCWRDLLFRVYENKQVDSTSLRYKECIVCKEWLHYPNFYEWLHSQENFEKWLNEERWCLDKDIINKHNKLYSSNNCCLVPNNVNTLFVKKNKNRGDLPIGVTYNHKKYMAAYSNPITGNIREYIGTYNTPEEAFYAYKEKKENLIKQIAQIEYNKNNIIKQCYDAMMKYKVEITD